MSISKFPLPDHALLAVYSRNGGYTDCYAVEIPAAVTFEQYVAAFYTTWVFKLERFILKYAVSRPSTDDQARQVAAGTLDAFAAWSVEARAPNQILMCDFMGRTRSWLMVEPLEGGKGTRLYFGSAFVAKRKSASDKPEFGFLFHALGGFHRLYSQILLGAAKQRLETRLR